MKFSLICALHTVMYHDGGSISIVDSCSLQLTMGRFLFPSVDHGQLRPQERAVQSGKRSQLRLPTEWYRVPDTR